MKCRYHDDRGVTFVEVMIVLAVVVTILALATPNMTNALYNVRLRSSANNVAGMLQAVRMQSVKDNRYNYMCTNVFAESTMIWISPTNTCSGPPANTDTQAQLGTGVVKVLTGAPGSLSLGFTPVPAYKTP